MKQAFRALDRILRGDATRLPLLQQGTFDVPVAGLLSLIILFGMIAGACMGVSSVITHWNPTPPATTAAPGPTTSESAPADADTGRDARYRTATPTATPQVVIGTREDGFKQLGASVVKVPMLFLLTLLITFPSLYVFNALVGSRLTLGAMLRLLVAAMAVMLAVLASFGPIVAFFAVSTTSYPFMKLLNVIVFAIAGFLGLAFLMQTLHRLTLAQQLAPSPAPSLTDPSDVTAPTPAGALDRTPDRAVPGNVRLVFRIWVFVFGLVGAQMAWVLRPFIGDPSRPFSFFRERDSNFFQGVAETLAHLLGVRW